VRRGSPVMLSFPPFTKAIIWLLALNTGVYLLLALLGPTMPSVSLWIFGYLPQGIPSHLGLQPSQVVFHGWIWQLVTYAFIHAGFWHWFGNMIGLWMFGSAFESAWGTRRFLELYSYGVIGAALTTIALSFTHALGSPVTTTVGASGGIMAILMAYGIVFGENEIMMIPFPFLIKAKYFVAILIVITIAYTISGGGEIAYLAHMGGLLFGYIYVKWVYGSSRSIANKGLGLSETYYGLRNSYYRWKRRRAARKFEVYMRKHDRTVQFDEHGNYIPPDDDKKNGGSKSGWVN
jgi:membrane associated rhomboid family serine protease